MGGPFVKDVSGFRMSAWYRSAAGYIDRVDPFTGRVRDPDANRSIDEGLRGAVTFSPAETVQITPSLTYEAHHAHDAPTFNLPPSDVDAGILQSTKLLPQPLDDEFYVASLKVAAMLRSAELTSVTSYFRRRVSAVTDATNNALDWGSALGPEFPSSDADALASTWSLEQPTFSQEIRLTSANPESRVSWIVGGIFLRASYLDVQTVYPHATADGRQVGDYTIVYDGREKQFAVFGDFNFRISERATANLGIRAEHANYEAAFTYTASAV